MYPCGEEPTERKMGGKIGMRLEKKSVYHIQVDQSGFYFFSQVATAWDFLFGARGAISCTSLPRGEL